MDERFETRVPSRQNIIDIFKGEWSTRAPSDVDFVTEPGHAQLFDDARVKWADAQFGSFKGKRVLELGPLEGAHSLAISKLGASEVVAIENNNRAFLKCLCMKELLSIKNVRFLLGDFSKFLEKSDERFDCTFACGVLYHMTDPVRLIENITRLSNQVFIWTHYLDWNVIQQRDDVDLFKKIERPNGFSGVFDGMARVYPEVAVDWKGFCGGQSDHAVWLSKNTILDLLKREGFSIITESFDHPDHPNGPAFAVCATRGQP